MKKKIILWIKNPFALLIRGEKKIWVILALACSTVLFSCKKEHLESGTPTLDAVERSNVLALAAAPLPTKAEALLAMQVYNNHFYNNMAPMGPPTKLIIGKMTITRAEWIFGRSKRLLKC